MSERKRTAVSSPQGSVDEPSAKKHALANKDERPTVKSSHTKKRVAASLPPEILEGKLTPLAIKRFKKEALLRALSSYRQTSEIFEKQAKRAQSRLDVLEKMFSLQESWWSNFVDQIDVAISNKTTLLVPSSTVCNNFLLKMDLDDDEEDKTLSSYKQKCEDLRRKIKSLLEWDGKVGEENDLRTQMSDTVNRLHSFEAEYNVLKSDTQAMQLQLKEMTEKYLAAKRNIARLESPVTNAIFGNGARSSAAPAGSRPDQQVANGSSAISTPHSPTPAPQAPEKEPTPKPAENTVDKAEYDKLKAQIEPLEAVIAKQLEQLREQDRQILSLNESIRSTTNRLMHLSDSDLQNAYQYRNLRRKVEEVLYQLDKLEALNAQYQREKSILVSERTGFQDRVRRDADQRIDDLQNRLTKAESDVARIRAARDDILGSLNIKKAQEAEKLKSLDHLKELVEIRDSRIKSLEQEIKRIKAEEAVEPPESALAEIENASIEQLRDMVKRLKQQNASLVEELPELEAAFHSAHQKATAKILDFAEREAKLSKLVAEKAKADEKYFSAMRSKDALNVEYQKVRGQLTRNAEWVQQLKESEKKSLHQVGVLEHRAEDLTSKATNLERDKAFLSTKLSECERRVDSLHALNERLNSDMRNRDKAVRQEVELRRTSEQEVAKLKKQLEVQAVGLANANAGGGGNNGGGVNGKPSMDLVDLQVQELRAMAICSVCTKNWKNTAIKVCGHVFCDECAMERLNARLRKCPLCNKQFSHSDLLPVHL